MKVEEIQSTKSFQAQPHAKHADLIADYDEATCVDQEHTCHNSDQWHMEKMAKMVAKLKQSNQKHELKLAELALCQAELTQSLPGPSHFPRLNFDLNTFLPNNSLINHPPCYELYSQPQ